jgi:hypothetical protein
MDPTDPVNHATFDPMHIILLRPLQTLLKIPVAAVEGIGMKSDLNHGYRTPFTEILQF